MKKFLVFLLMYLSTTALGYCADLRFVQVDGAMFNVNDNNSVSKFEKIIMDINKQKDVEFVVFSGNNISRASKENLEGFVNIAKNLEMPFYFILGNKDVSVQKKFGKKEYTKFLRKKVKSHWRIKSTNYVIAKKDVIFIVLDGAKEVIPTNQGYYRPQTLDWLEVQLNKYNDKNVILLQHFPIVPPAKKELYYTFKADEYLELVNNHKNIKAIFSGHFGVNKEQKVGDILHVSTANAPQYRIVDIMDCDGENPVFWSTLKR